MAAELFGLERSGSRNLYAAGVLILAVTMLLRIFRLRISGVRILFWRLPFSESCDDKRSLAWLISAAVMGGYSVYEIALRDGSIFLVNCVISTLLMFIVSFGLTRNSRPPGAGDEPEDDHSPKR